MARERVKIEGMGCSHCVAAVRTALEKLAVDIHQVEIGEVEISYGNEIERTEIEAAIAEAGYRPVEYETLS